MNSRATSGLGSITLTELLTEFANDEGLSDETRQAARVQLAAMRDSDCVRAEAERMLAAMEVGDGGK